jgi:outer membrane protein assembly factor BamE (lipoprotein component of BamABCDE complex)
MINSNATGYGSITLGRKVAMSLLGAASLALAACASTGVRVDEAAVSKFQPGKTTYLEVVKSLGAPTTSMLMPDGRRMILYTYAQVRMRAASFVPIVGMFAGGADSKSTNVSFNFDAQGVLINDSASQTQFGTGTGLISGAAPNGAVANQPRVAKP